VEIAAAEVDRVFREQMEEERYILEEFVKTDQVTYYYVLILIK